MNPFEPVLAMLREAGLDATRALREFQAAKRSEDLDGFLSHLLETGTISNELFRALHASEGIEVGKLLEVRADKTLVLEKPPRTLTLAEPTASTPLGAETVAPASGAIGSSSTVEEFSQGQRRYSILGLLGRGAMGEVTIARDEELLRKVAYKRMIPDAAVHRELVARFFSEAQVTAQLDHPHIVPIYGVEVEADGTLGYSMKLVQGKTLREILDEERATVTSVGVREAALRRTQRLEIFLRVCDGIAFAHSKGVVHRDLKPDNIMVGRFNEVYVMDWGICRIMGATDGVSEQVVAAPPASGGVEERTQLGALLGTPAYMSPEQAEGRNAELDGRSDLFALGLILFELVSLRRAMTGDTMNSVLGNVREAKLEPLVHQNPRVRLPTELRAIVAKATARDRDDRYPSVTAFAEDIRRYLRGDAVNAKPDDLIRAAARWVSQHRGAALGAIAALLLLGSAAVIGVLVHERFALGRARVREERMQAFLSAVEERAHAIDNEFFRDQQLLTGLAGHVAELLTNGASPPKATVYLNRDFEGGRKPPDMTDSPYYGLPVSLDFPVFQLAPDVSPKAVEGDLRRLSLLTPTFHWLMTESMASDGEGNPSTATGRERLLTDGAPILRVFLTLPNGVHCVYPGIGGFAADYDGRKRPKYLLAAGKRGIQWGDPYRDQFGHGLLLPSSVSVYDAMDNLLAVTGISTTFEFIEKHLLELPEHPSVEEADLVDDHAQVVVSWRRDGAVEPQPTQTRKAEGHAIKLRALGISDVRAAILEGAVGRREVDVARRTKVVGFYRLKSLGWYYVVTADEPHLFGLRG